MITVNEDNNDKAKILGMNLFFLVFCLLVLLPNSMSKLIDNRCTCKLIIKTTAAYVHMHTNNCASLFMF